MTFAERLGSSASDVFGRLAERLPYIVMGLVLLLLTWWVARLVQRVVRAALARTSTAGHVDVLVGKAAGAATFVVGVILSLSVMGVQVSTLVTSLGLTAVTIGFALKDILANTMAGILLLLQRPFTLGDSVSVAGLEGVVRDIRVRDTLIEQPDGRMAFVPNASVFNATIVNTSASRRRRVEVVVQVPADQDLPGARAAALAAIERVEGMLGDAPAEARYVRTDADSAALAVRRWVDTSETPFAVARDASIAAVLRALSEAGIALAGGE